jgi:YD repeat-containing protein
VLRSRWSTGFYDAANRLVEELSPEVELDGAPRERVLTRFFYDAAGNQIRTTLAAGTVEANTESLTDAAGAGSRLVNGARTLHVFGYDANGNQSSLKRFITPVPNGIDLATATLAQVMASVPLVATGDQESVFGYDALNRQVTHTDMMGAGSADDIVVSSRYDAMGTVTSRTDAEGFTTQVAYDELNHTTQTITPDGSSSFVEYDAAGESPCLTETSAACKRSQLPT